jgi:hypothetical protein
VASSLTPTNGISTPGQRQSGVLSLYVETMNVVTPGKSYLAYKMQRNTWQLTGPTSFSYNQHLLHLEI